jgi:hypothetical protein
VILVAWLFACNCCACLTEVCAYASDFDVDGATDFSVGPEICAPPRLYVDDAAVFVKHLEFENLFGAVFLGVDGSGSCWSARCSL